MWGEHDQHVMMYIHEEKILQLNFSDFNFFNDTFITVENLKMIIEELEELKTDTGKAKKRYIDGVRAALIKPKKRR